MLAKADIQGCFLRSTPYPVLIHTTPQLELLVLRKHHLKPPRKEGDPMHPHGRQTAGFASPYPWFVLLRRRSAGQCVRAWFLPRAEAG